MLVQKMSKRRRLNATTIFDPVHREYELGPEIIDIINKTKFQRLRRLKQLATAHWVWLGATHTRFEHSISVAYLAGHMAKNLQQKQPELQITERQILLVRLAGLLLHAVLRDRGIATTLRRARGQPDDSGAARPHPRARRRVRGSRDELVGRMGGGAR